MEPAPDDKEVAVHVHISKQSGVVPRRKVVPVGVPHTNKPVPVLDKVAKAE